MKLKHAYPTTRPDIAARQPDVFEQETIDRHHQVAEIIARHLDAIQAEIIALDQETMNIEFAGDHAEIARQVLTLLVDQLRGFSAMSRQERQAQRNRRREIGLDC
jgi:hypothetical protein